MQKRQLGSRLVTPLTKLTMQFAFPQVTSQITKGRSSNLSGFPPAPDKYVPSNSVSFRDLQVCQTGPGVTSNLSGFPPAAPENHPKTTPKPPQNTKTPQPRQ